MVDKELLEALKEQSESMDRVAKAQWLLYMATQKLMESRTPSNTVFGSFTFNPGSVNTTLAEWRQIVPRNSRRKTITFMAINQSLYLTNSSNSLDINTLITQEKSGFLGTVPVMLATFAGGVPLVISTTDSIWAASLTGNGSVIEQNAVLNWVEEVYSDINAIPVEMHNTNPTAPGVVEKLTPGAMALDGDIRATFTREGVR